MIIICEECGKKYNINPDRIRNEKAWVTCKSCKHRFQIVKRNPNKPERTIEPVHDFLDAVPVEENLETDPTTATVTEKGPATPFGTAPAAATRAGRFGLTMKFLLYMLVPFICIYAASSTFSLHKMKQMNEVTVSETTDIVWQVAKRSLRDKAESVALQTRQYLYSHPDLKNFEFNRDIYFKKIANQKMGVTGYTFLYEMPGPDAIWRIWAHVNPKLVGIDMSLYKQSGNREISDFWKVFTGVESGELSEGFYSWQNPKGETINKYMVSVPVAGTPYVVAATTETAEFVRPIDIIEAKLNMLSGETRRANTIALLAGFLFLGAIILLYGRNLTARIRRLATVADRICVGELNVDVDISARDEIGELEDAIGRMRDSIKVSIERLRRRRRRVA